MATPRKTERRVLSHDEFELVQNTHHPALAQLDKKDLDRVTKLLRERRDRAQDILNRQRRDIRTKGLGRTTFAEEERGTRRKKAVLREALGRVSKEQSRRNAKAGLKQSARRALALKRSTPASKTPSAGHTPDEGMKPKTSARRDQIVNPMDAGRVSQKGKVAQAKRDSR
ncbi:hypothetical protein [Microvirga alba]|uniref:Uncharacterized protein n=1 Tax=Microvirga alba TaxID=2791025 RepID=A0A931BWN7_9HYPH|nr:hypothetical protein [Microvirga alba]MBF9234197.1 hypothetical protein [Microvirga alba]